MQHHPTGRLASIGRIAKYRQTDRFKMYPNLMGAAGQRPCFYQ